MHISKSPYEMYFHFHLFWLGFHFLTQSSSMLIELGTGNCSVSNSQVTGGIGGVVDLSSRVGKEQKLAMEMAVQDINNLSTCFKLDLHFRDSCGTTTRAASAVMELVEDNQVQAYIGTFTMQEAALLYEFEKLTNETPIISITPTAKVLPEMPLRTLSFIQMSNDITIHMQCMAAIIGHFRWRRVTAIFEHSNSFGTDSGLITQLSDSLQRVDSVIARHLAFPPVSSLSNPEGFIHERLEKVRGMNDRVFIVLQSSLQFAALLFEKAKQIGLMEKECVWIISDDIASLIDSFGPSVISSMQGVIGFRSYFMDTNEAYKKFKLEFQRKYRSEYPEEEGHSNPSIFALRTYDATRVLAKAIQRSQRQNAPKNLLESIAGSGFEGLSGEVNFSRDMLAQLPTFRIINVVGRSYREVALRSQEFGFFDNVLERNGTDMRNNNGWKGDLSSLFWPGGLQTIPKGWTLGEKEKPLKVGVPARGAFNQFVKVTYDQQENKTYVMGFSIDVFEAVVKQLPYYLPFVFVPYNGSYDEMVAEVHNKSLDAAVGDTAILADRCEVADFSQPYIDSGLVMVVKETPNVNKEKFVFIKAFKLEMWVLMAAMSIFTGCVVWLTEHAEDNPEFGGSVSHKFGRILWFSVTVLTLSQRESIRSNLSRFVLAVWLFVIVIVTACFTAVLTSMMTVTQLRPAIVDIDYLRRTNAAVGCNGNSFIVNYLVNVLHFHQDNIKRINSIKDYPEAFKRGEISAAFFVAPHAKVFLAQYCQGYTIAGPRFQLGGLGFVFPKGSPLVADISEAILKVIQTGKITQLENQMLFLANCSTSTAASDVPSLGPGPFSGLFIVSGTISAVAFLITVARVLGRHWPVLSFIHDRLIQRRVGRWASRILSRTHTVHDFGLSAESRSNRKENHKNMCADNEMHSIRHRIGSN